MAIVKKQVNGMTLLKTSTQLTTLLFTLAFSNTLFAEESVKNANKNNGTSNAVSNADVAGHADGSFSFAVNTQANATASSQQKITNDIHTFKQMEERRRQMQEAQLKAYKRHLQERRQQSAAENQGRAYSVPKDVQARRDEYIKLMDERRTLMKKMMDEHRQAAEERRKIMLLKMHQTSTTPELANKA